MKGLLFIDGEAPSVLPQLEGYDLIGCTDGAIVYLHRLKMPADKLDFISGDMDSISSEILKDVQDKIISTPDQDDTDFKKALDILFEKGCLSVDVYGGSGGEQDHFLGNLSAGLEFKDRMKIRFYDDYAMYLFLDKHFEMSNVQGKMISLVPFPIAEKVVTKGLKWPLNHEDLKMGGRIGTRNVADEDTISVDFQAGELLIFVGKN